MFLPVIFITFKKKGNTEKRGQHSRKKEPQKLKQARAHNKLLIEVDDQAWEEEALITSHEATALHAVACNLTSNSTNTMSNGRLTEKS